MFKIFRILFGLKFTCPRCGAAGAKESFSGTICPNAQCVYYSGFSSAAKLASAASSPAPVPLAKSKTGFQPEQTISLDYINWKGERKTFVADSSNVRRRKGHLLARVVPKGTWIALKIDRITNKAMLLPLLGLDPNKSLPDAHESYVMDFHRRRGSTSPLNERLKAKYLS